MAILDLQTGEPVGTLTQATVPRGKSPPTTRGRVLDLETGEPVADTPEPQQFDFQKFREKVYAETAKEIGPIDAFMRAMGKGFQTVGQGLGVLDEPTERTERAYGAVAEERPITTGAGEIVGQALPFVPPAVATGGIASLAGRVAAGGALGALEGGAIARGEGKDIDSGIGIGAAVGAGSEILFPVIGRLGRRIFEQITGKVPKGRLFDAQGNPVPEMSEALEGAGMTMDDLTEDAAKIVRENAEAADPEQVARVATFAQEGVSPTRSEAMTSGKFKQQATEQRLLQSGQDALAEPFRQFKLQQSEQIKRALDEAIDYQSFPEETGETLVNALANRRKLLRSQKNALYAQAEEGAKDLGGVPVFVDTIADVVPDADKLDDLAITAPSAVESAKKLLTKYGILDPTQEAIESGFQPTMLSLKNVESFRKALNGISRGDQTGAVDVLVGPVKNALDTELDELGSILAGKGFPEEVLAPLKEARKTVRQLKTEFSPQSITGRLVGMKKDGVTPIIEASQAYNKLVARSQPIENVRRTVNSLLRAGGEGTAALKNLQMTTLMDLVNAGYSTASRTIDGVPVFNPGAFRKQIKQIGQDKLEAIFRGNKSGLAKINNIEKIAKVIQPSADAVPKGSAPVLMDLMDKLGVATLSGAAPGGGASAWEVIKRVTGGIGQRTEVARSMKPQIEQIQYMMDEMFPGIGAALSIPAVIGREESTEQSEN